MLNQHQADRLLARLHAAIMATVDLAKPSALIHMLMDAMQAHKDNTPGVLAAHMLETCEHFETERGPALTPSVWQEIISEVYRRMFYQVDELTENGLDDFLEDGKLEQFTDWLCATLRGEQVAAQFNLAEMH